MPRGDPKPRTGNADRTTELGRVRARCHPSPPRPSKANARSRSPRRSKLLPCTDQREDLRLAPVNVDAGNLFNEERSSLSGPGLRQSRDPKIPHATHLKRTAIIVSPPQSKTGSGRARSGKLEADKALLFTGRHQHRVKTLADVEAELVERPAEVVSVNDSDEVWPWPHFETLMHHRRLNLYRLAVETECRALGWQKKVDGAALPQLVVPRNQDQKDQQTEQHAVQRSPV